MRLAVICLFLSSAALAQIRTETRVVLVDAVVTDKKGAYVRGLTQKDFRVWEDNKEQTVSSFTVESDAASKETARKHYLVLFFDNSTSSPSDQVQARQAASKFIDSNAGPDRLMAVVNFSGALQVAQNFTDDSDRLKKVVAGVKFASVGPAGGPNLSPAFSSFSSRSVLYALRDLAKGLSAVPGRKTLIFISGGFPLNREGLVELTAAIDSCNRANVAVYPIDVHGLVAPPPRASLFNPAGLHPAGNSWALPRPSSFQIGLTGLGNSPRGGGARSSNRNTPMPGAAPAPIEGTARDQQVLYSLASGTGGFVIVNTNDLLSGFDKIGKEQSEYYLLGYTPSKELEPGVCHAIKVKVDQGGTSVRARSGYCDVKPLDVLSGTAAERDLETRGNAGAAPTVSASMRAPFFYTAPDTARVDLAMEIPSSSFNFTKEKGKLHAAMNVVGIVYLSGGGVAARFSDTVKMDLEDKKQVDAFNQKPYRYEKQFDVASGAYNLRVLFGSGGSGFGKLEMPLVVDSYDTGSFAISSLALSKDARAVDPSGLGAGAALLEDRVPLVVNGIQLTPAGAGHFSAADRGFIYTEVYEPAMLAPDLKEAPAIAVQLQIVDARSGAVKVDSGMARIKVNAQPGNPAVPVGLRLELAGLAPGAYQVRVTALDAQGRKAARSADFEVDR